MLLYCLYLLSRLSGLQHENLSLKQQLDTSQQIASERAGFDLQEKLNTMMATLKADHDKVASLTHIRLRVHKTL